MLLIFKLESIRFFERHYALPNRGFAEREGSGNVMLARRVLYLSQAAHSRVLRSVV